MTSEIGQKVLERIDALAEISDEPGRLTRLFCSPAMRRANELVGSWMVEAGMGVRQDAIGNLIGHYPAATPQAKILVVGSHLDTVRDAGKFDGALGVLAGIACVELLKKQRLPFAIEVVGFADEEGVRYKTAYLGSRAFAGTFDTKLLENIDSKGISMAEAIRNFGGSPDMIGAAKVDSNRLLGYVEVHIEQGPVLEQKNLQVGVVSSIAGQQRAQVTFQGRAAHAGTTPMSLRRDALCAAAEFVLAVESLAQSRGGLVATVGEIAALPGAGNVIPGEARLSLDVRHPEDSVRKEAVANLRQRAEAIADERKLRLSWNITHETPGVICDRRLSTLLTDVTKRHQPELALLHSGAGHDAAIMAAITPATMLFLRCKEGLSHNPAESASAEDITVAIEVMSEFLQRLARES